MPDLVVPTRILLIEGYWSAGTCGFYHDSLDRGPLIQYGRICGSYQHSLDRGPLIQYVRIWSRESW
jgi:hypothetical protein